VEVIEKWKEVLGKGHPSTLTSMYNLAFTIRALGRRQSALNLMSLCADMSSAWPKPSRHSRCLTLQNTIRG
jgi:hypothetical protein